MVNVRSLENRLNSSKFSDGYAALARVAWFLQ